MFEQFPPRLLGEPQSFIFIRLFSHTAKLQFPPSSLREEFSLKYCLMMTLRDSNDEEISEAGAQTRTGQKWSASHAASEVRKRQTHHSRHHCRYMCQ